MSNEEQMRAEFEGMAIPPADVQELQEEIKRLNKLCWDYNHDCRIHQQASNDKSERIAELEQERDAAIAAALKEGIRSGELERKLAEQDASFDETIGERDVASNSADELAEEVARFFGVDIGEHSNMNDPWENAYEAIPRETLSQLLSQAREEGRNEAVPDGWREELLLIEAILKGYPVGFAQSDAMRAVRRLLAAAPSPASLNAKEGGE